MREKVNQLFKDKFVLVMLVLGLLTIGAAAGAVKIRRGSQYMEESPYLEIQEPDGVIAGSKEETPTHVAGSSNADEAVKTGGEDAEAVPAEDKEIVYPAESAEINMAEVPAAEEAGTVLNDTLALGFTETSRLSWPVMGNIILGYSMDSTTYFPTLEQYKCNPANIIQSDISTPVMAPADARVLEIGSNEEIGSFVKLDFGNGYGAVCGQLKEIPVVENEYLHRGDVIGYIAEPTKYYSVEGNNLYFEFLHEDEPIDALDYLE